MCEFLKEVRERGVTVFANETAVDVVGNAEKSLGRAGVNCGSEARVSPNASEQRGAKGRVVDVFVLLTVRHKKSPLTVFYYQPMRKRREECRARTELVGDDVLGIPQKTNAHY